LKLRYINPDAPRVKPPEYPGRSYEATVPATLDLAERAALAVNALTEPTDPDFDHELYWIADLLATTPAMYHTADDTVQAKFIQSLPLVRTMCGSTQNLDIERALLQTMLRMQGDDGLMYIPIRGRPWALPAEPSVWAGLDYLPKGDHWCPLHMTGRLLGALCIYALKEPHGPWRDAAHRLVEGFRRVTIIEDDIAYLILNCTEPGKRVEKPAKKPVGWRAGMAAWVAQGLAQCHRALGNETAGDLAQRMMRYVMRDSGCFREDGEFGPEFPDIEKSKPKLIHFHMHTNQILAALEVAQATGDKELLDRALRAYSYAVNCGQPLVGFFPEWISSIGGSWGTPHNQSEICTVADMIACAVKLSLLGHDKWDDVDRWVRNQFAECQLTDTGWLTDGHLEKVNRTKLPLPAASAGIPKYGTTERVIERCVGSFAGWPAANDWVEGNLYSIMHCCTGNATRALYYVWENILAFDEGRLRVNLLLNRASKWADLDSHIPFAGKVELKLKRALELEIRLPEWVESKQARSMVNGRPRKLTFAGWYANVGRVRKGDSVVLTFPLPERTDIVNIEKQRFTLIRRGNDVVHIDPPGKNGPLYQRGYFRAGETLWKQTTRYVPEQEIPWS